MRSTDEGLFPALEAALKAANAPMDCHALFDIPDIKKFAPTPHRVSDYLGNMWRKGLVIRLPAPKETNSKSRWMYQWRGQKGPKIHDHAFEYTPKVLADRPTVLITEEGNVITLEFPNLIISVRQKPGK